MTEAEWLAGGDPVPMLQLLRNIGRENGRKLRLFAVACCRILLGKVRVHLSMEHAVDVAERYADGGVGVADLQTVRRYANSTAEHACMNASEIEAGIGMADAAAGNAAWAATQPGTIMPDDNGISAARLAAEEAMQCDLLRCIVGNPFQPPTFGLPWFAASVKDLAGAIYDERAFDLLPILADALEDAGCTDRAILAHLRIPGLHARGCWVLDLILSKS